MIQEKNKVFEIATDHTSYVFSVLESGHLEHLYYGKKLHGLLDSQALKEKMAFLPGNTNQYRKGKEMLTLEDICLEMSSYGKGDIREPMIEAVFSDGSSTCDFLFEKAEISSGKKPLVSLPSSYEEEEKKEKEELPDKWKLPEKKKNHLCVTLRDKHNQMKLELHYHCFEKEDVITRYCVVSNFGKDSVRLTRLLSMSLDFHDSDYILSSFHGEWAREMEKKDLSLVTGKYVNSSFTGTSSSRANPFFMLSRPETSENFGECMGFNLIYSGNHYEAAEVSGFSKLRLVSGINPEGFEFLLEPGMRMESPEAVFTWSDHGKNGMSQNMHEFVREHIVRGNWKKKERPVLLNSWEAAYFNITEKKLLRMAKAGKDAGIELFVMDDGWFGNRNDDTSSLGDWTVNKKKLPGGLKGFGDKLKEMGLLFGIWVEPEMVSVNSDLYRKHPEWVLEIPGKPHSEGRNQRILDLGNSEVQKYIIEEMTRVFSSADISYVKWDMNRTFTDYYSRALSKEHQGEVAHRYVCGLYHCMRVLTKRFPDILFEGCSAGGNRFDLGILCYFPQIWGSDNTDALCRAQIQTGYSYGYPLSTVSAHVSGCPNHQTLRNTPLETRFAAASFGVLGYECNFCDLKKEELAEIKEQIAVYKKWRKVLQTGTFYRGRITENAWEWICVSQNQEKAVGMKMQALVRANSRYEDFRALGLKEEAKYHFYNVKRSYDLKLFGDLVNTASPIHIKKDSLLHDLAAKMVRMEGETEDYTLYGDTLMNGGVRLKQGFAATGYSDEVRFYPDFASRLYFMEEDKESNL